MAKDVGNTLSLVVDEPDAVLVTKDERRRETEEVREGGRGDGSYKDKLGAHTSQVEMEAASQT